MTKKQLEAEEFRSLVSQTLAHYNRRSDAFWAGTKDHDVSQNISALLRAIESPPPFRLLDFGCGPGRDLRALKELGHRPVGLDGAESFVLMARRWADVEVLHQNFLELALPAEHFDGIFANASLFHVPSFDLPRVLRQLRDCLKPRGVLFSSNPRGQDEELQNGSRYGCYWSWETWSDYLVRAGFDEVEHFYRPEGKPRDQQLWLASVWRKND